MRVLYLSDFDLVGSGYMNLSIPLCAGLADLNHEIKVVGLRYNGAEHPYKFSLIPAPDFPTAISAIRHLFVLWRPEVLIVALDIPIQAQVLKALQGMPCAYIGIMPIESTPLILEWAMVLVQMSCALIISEFGTAEAVRNGVFNAEYIPLGIDARAWRPPSEEERNRIRESLGIGQEEFVILTVADNQERKNLSSAFEIFANFAKGKEDVRYQLVTREYLNVGWKLRSLAKAFDIQDKVYIYERGMDFRTLWGLYSAADCFFLPSKAEGLGLPLLEAMSVGLPCVATNCTGMAELLSEGRGILVDYEYTHIDPFGNSLRFWIDKKKAQQCLELLYADRFSGRVYKEMRIKAREYVESRTWDKAISKLDEVIRRYEQKPT